MQVDWTLLDFDGQVGHLQMDLENLQAKQVNLDVYDELQITFNGAPGQFKSAGGKQINFGQQVSWQLPPLINKGSASNLEALSAFWVVLICVLLSISLLLALFQGSLVASWMLINTLQLIAHMPLLSDKLPANANYFFLNFLSILRLNLDWLAASLDTVESKLLEYSMVEDGSSFFGSQLTSSGYQIDFVRNMLTILVLAGLIALLWAFTALLKVLKQRGA